MLLLRLKRRHVLLFAGWCVLWVSTPSWFLVLFKFSIFLLIFCIVVLSIIENRYVFKLWLPRWLRIHLQCRRCRFDLWVGKIPWRRAWQSTPVFLPGEAHGQSSLADYGPCGLEESSTVNATEHICTHVLKSLFLLNCLFFFQFCQFLLYVFCSTIIRCICVFNSYIF